ncbi:MAG: hypothetical protein NTY37_13045 [Methanothrix sp.]|nr:hypothetical protein [Methanothrix sp.]
MTRGDLIHTLVLRAAGLETLAVRPRFIPYFAPGPATIRGGGRGPGHQSKPPPSQTGDAQEMPVGAANDGQSAPTYIIRAAKSGPGTPEVHQPDEMKRPPGEAEGASSDERWLEPSRGGWANAAKPTSVEADETGEIGARDYTDEGAMNAKKTTAGYVIDGDALAKYDDAASNASNDAHVPVTGQSRALLDDGLPQSPAPAKVLPIDQDLHRGRGDLDQSRSLKPLAGSSDIGGEMARPTVSSEEDQQAFGVKGDKRSGAQEKAASVERHQRPTHSDLLEEDGSCRVSSAEIASPIHPLNIPEKLTPQEPGTVHVRIGTLEIHAEAPPPKQPSGQRPSGFQGYDMIRSYMSWEY